MKKKSLFIILLVMTLLISILPGNVSAQLETPAGAAILLDASSGQVLFEKNADSALPPASITKIMTLLVAFEAMENGKVKGSDIVTVSENAWRMSGSRMFLEVNQKVTIDDLITGISIVSANDACVALAEYLYGSENAFVRVMNQRAAELGLSKTHFENATGLPVAGHTMSARDIATLARYLINKFPRILEIESTRELTFNNIRQFNRNPLLGKFPGADGLKTGWTDEAGYCLVGTAKQEDTRLISVVLHTANENERLLATQEILNHGFKNFEKKQIVKAGDLFESIPVKDGKKQSVALVAESDISVIIPVARENEIIKATTLSPTLNAPVVQGAEAGLLEIKLDDKVIGSTRLVTAEAVKKAGFFERLFRAIGNFFKSIF